MAEQIPGGSKRVTLGADRGYDTLDFGEQMREFRVTPHVPQNDTHRRSAIDDGPRVSLGMPSVSENENGSRKSSLDEDHRLAAQGAVPADKVGWMFTFAAAAYNLVRMRNLMAQPA